MRFSTFVSSDNNSSAINIDMLHYVYGNAKDLSIRLEFASGTQVLTFDNLAAYTVVIEGIMTALKRKDS